jgi:hypothetical protein
MTNRKAQNTEITFNMAGTQSAVDESIINDGILADALLDELSELEGEIVENSHEAEDPIDAVAAKADAADPEAAVEDKPKKEKKAKAPKEPKEPKAPRVTSITHKPGDRLVALLGDKSFIHFSFKDDAEANASRVDSFIEAMNTRDAIADKVKDKAIMLFTWLKSEKPSSDLNEVMLRAFSTLNKDGELTSGKNGNLQTNLLSKPYSPGTAASQANQMFMLFPLLGITKREKGKMVADEDSAILTLVNARLGL